MNHFLPAVCLSTFLGVAPKANTFLKSNSSKSASLYHRTIYKSKEITYADKFNVEECPPVLGLRVAAVTLTNNTGQNLVLKKNLKIATTDYFADPIDFTPPLLPKKQATSVFFLYNLLHQRLPKLLPLSSGTPVTTATATIPEFYNQPQQNLFVANTQDRDIAAELKEANLFYKSLAPGQTLSGLILFNAASAASLQFYLN